MSRRHVGALEAIVLEFNKATSTTERQAYDAGHQAGLHGANEVTAHYRYFTRPELTAAWERGNGAGKLERRRK